jgi:hypothetical protein
MLNPLTGDFEAVLQVSGGTINRLLASMHQNAFNNPKLHSVPHRVGMRIGDDYAFEGVRGVVHAQISVPRVELIHGATDRFILEVGVRAWYRPDAGTEPMPAFIHGTVRAEYRVQDIDSSCPGWSKKAFDFLWIRVVRDSVRFQGTAEDDQSTLQTSAVAPPSNPAVNIEKISRQIARLLARRFEATPHHVSSRRFRRGSLRSLNPPMGGSAVALPLALSGEPLGQITSIENVLLNGSDLAVAVNINFIMNYITSLVNPALDEIKKFIRSIQLPVVLQIDEPTVEWLPQGFFGVFKVRLKASADLDFPLPDASLSIEQDVVLNFDGRFWLSPGSLSVTVTAIGSGQIAPMVKNKVVTAVQDICKNAQSFLDKMTQTGELLCELHSMDDQASISLDSAEFVTHGIVIRGRIGLAPRQRAVVKHEKTAAGDAHSAFESWIPGGRIDRLEWSWTWFVSGSPGNKTHRDRFLLPRPSGRGRAGRWGLKVDVNTPLPGLDGSGSICLRIAGVRIDPVTGEFVKVVSTKQCTRFGLPLRGPVTKGERLFLRDMPELSQDVPFPQLRDLPLVGVKDGRNTAQAANTLLIHVNEGWTDETAEILRRGLEECRRYDAGLAVLVLFREGVLDATGPGAIAEIEKFARQLGIAAQVNEDVNSGWSRALELSAGSGGPAWAIITPEGYTPWKHSGHIDAQSLASALDIHLRQCPDLKPAPYRSPFEVGTRIGLAALHPSFGDLADFAEPRCPPMPLGRAPGETVVTFVHKGARATAIHLRRLASQYGQRESEGAPEVVVVLDRADEREAEILKKEQRLDFLAIADPAGKITDRFGVDVWPTTIKLDWGGTVSEVEIGIPTQRDRESLRKEDDDPHHPDAV